MKQNLGQKNSQKEWKCNSIYKTAIGDLKHMRNFHLDDQSAILEKIHQQMEEANFESEASVLSVEQIQDIVRRRVSPVFQPR
ncbi:hypothetical protein Sango_2214600 [Sesamum angolense]|uniref:Uncharacterized protein n=1 Tax=Sesamum angolense TaxID=2727404 RepID=A0AAE2BKJ9_9LAMI|nr:hypothetical protein Sango_2214600 [Sesamum angolense]